MRIFDVLPPKLKSSEQRVARIASYFALAGLTLFALSIFHPKPLTVIFSMTVGHVLGSVAVLLYLIAIILDTRARPASKPKSEATTSTEVQSQQKPE